MSEARSTPPQTSNVQIIAYQGGGAERSGQQFCIVYDGTHSHPLRLAAPGQPGPTGPSGLGPSDPNGPGLLATPGSLTVTPSATPGAFLKAAPVELLRSILDSSILTYATGRAADVAPALSWAADIANSAPAEDSDMRDIGTQARQLTVRILAGADLYGHEPTYVQTDSIAAIDRDLKDYLDNLATMQSQTDQYKQELNQQILSLQQIQFHKDTLSQAKVQAQTEIDRNAKRLAELEGDAGLVTQAVRSTAQAAALLEVAINAYNSEQERLRPGCSIGIKTLLSIGQIAYGIFSGGASAISGMGAVISDLADHKENRENLKKNGAAIYSGINDVVNNFEAVNKLPPDQQANTVIVVNGDDYLSQVDKIKAQAHPDQPGGPEVLAKIDILVAAANSKNALIIKRAGLRARQDELSASLSDIDSQLTDARSAVATNSLSLTSPYVAALNSRLRQAQGRVLEVMYNLNKGYSYLTASDTTPLNVTDFSWAVLKDAASQAQKDFHDRLDSLNKDVSEDITFTIPQKIVSDLHAQGEARFSIPLFAVSDPQRKTWMGSWDRDMSDRVLVFATALTVSVANAFEDFPLDIEILHGGSVLVRDAGGKARTFTHAPLGYPMHLVKVPGKHTDKITLVGVDNDGLPLSPFALWTVKVSSHGNLRLRNDSEVTLTFNVRSRLVQTG